MRTPHTSLILMLLVCFSAMVGADHYTYTWNTKTNTWQKSGQQFSMVNSSEACIGFQCGDVDCTDCHASMGANRLSADPTQMRTHLEVHFAKTELRLAESQRTTLGGLTLTRVGGRLVMEAPGGARYRFPTGSRIIRNRNNQPLFVVSPGTDPPQIVR